MPTRMTIVRAIYVDRFRRPTRWWWLVWLVVGIAIGVFLSRWS